MKPHLAVIRIIGVIVPRRLRADWREEWEAELRHRERLLADWQRLDAWHKRDLLRRSLSAFWDALWLQGQRREDEMVQDLRFGFRMLVKSPLFTSVAIVTLALGIGANTAVFSFVNALLLRPLQGVERPDQLVQIGRQYRDKNYLSDASYPDFLDYRARNTTTLGLAAIAPTAFHLNVRGDTERVEGELVTGDYFDVLGVSAIRGRLIAPADDLAGAGPVAVISARLWRQRFGAAEDVIGTAATLDGRPFTIVGIAGEEFSGIKIGTPRDIWVPLATLRRTNPKLAARFDERHPSWLELLGRLRPGVTLEEARAEFSAIAQQLEQAYPATNARAGAGVDPGLGRDVEVARQLRWFAALPFVAVTIVLLIACANVAGLLLTRAASRRREIATRLALGAGRVRIIRQLLAESVTLAVASGLAGLMIGRWLTVWLRNLLPERYLFLSFNVDFGLDWRVFGFTFGIATATGILFGLVPALYVSRPDLVPTLKGPRASGQRSGVLMRGSLVVAEVALSLILLIAAGLCVRTLANAAAIDTGYQTTQVLTARIDLAKQNYTEERGRLFQASLLERLQSLPGVEAAGLAVTLPLNDGRWQDSIRRERDPARVQTFQNLVSPRYFDAMKIPLLVGRHFSIHDGSGSPRVAILNQTLAHVLWPAENPVGKHIRFKGDAIEVVGVVRDIKGRDLFAAPDPILYLPLFQDYSSATVLHVRTSVPSQQFIPTLQRHVHALDGDLPVYAVKTLDEHVTATLTPQRLLAHLISGFGVLALLLALVGLYALMAYAVSDRTQEIGIRMALGARRGDVMRLFVTRGMILALSGVALGLAAGSALTRLMKSVLFGVSPLDPITFTVVPLVLLASALVACSIPAARAARADPTVALRYE